MRGAPLQTAPFLRRLQAIATPSDEEREVLASLSGPTRQLRPNEDIASIGEQPLVVCIMLEGIACRYKISADGKRQIMSFHLPGDIPDLNTLFVHTMDHNFGAGADNSHGCASRQNARHSGPLSPHRSSPLARNAARRGGLS